MRIRHKNKFNTTATRRSIRLGLFVLLSPALTSTALSNVSVTENESTCKPSIVRARQDRLTGQIMGIDLAPGSDLAAAALSNLHVRIWHLDTGRTEKELVFPDPVTDARQKNSIEFEPIRVHFSPDGKTLAISYLGRILLYDSPAWSQVSSLGVSGEDLLRESRVPQLKRRSDATEAETDDLNKYEQLREKGDGRTRITEFSFTPDGASIIAAYCRGGCYDNLHLPRLMAFPSGNDPVRLWDVESKQLMWEVVIDKRGVIEKIVVSPDGKWFAASDRRPGFCRVSLYDVRERRLVSSLPETDFLFAAPAILFTPGSNRLITFQIPKEIPRHKPWDQLAIYDGQDGELIAEFPGTQGMRDAAISPDGLWLASTNSRGWIFQIWGIEARKVVSTTVLGGLFNTATFDLIRFSPDGQRVVVASRFQRWVNVYKFQSCHSPKSDPTSYLDQR